ncbi:O-antigen ligase family protein [Herbaspirillum robiniae]|uniref:O-antigen ligase family protein n=1 Tax=Herbaspirillum robiniae TaxID=2014887 RepID=UPI003D76D8BC
MSEKPMLPVPMQWMIFVAATAFIVLGLSVDKIAGISYYVMLLLGIVAVFIRGRSSISSFLASCRTFWPLYLAVSGFTFCLILSQIIVANGSAKDFNFALRFQGFILLFWVFLHLPRRFFRWLGVAFAIAALAATAKTYWMTAGGIWREHPNFMPILAYTELAGISGALAICTIKWDAELPVLIRIVLFILKVMAGLGGLYAIYLYQSRGAWLAIPVFAVATCVLFLPTSSMLRKMAAVLAIMLVVAGIYGSTDSVRERLLAARNDVVQFENKSDLNTSVGTRFQLWQASLRLYQENAFIGVGINGYSRALRKMADEGVISEGSAQYPHSHNELLFTAVLFGSCGIVALLALYFIPVAYFVRYARGQPGSVKAAACMGTVLCLSYFLDGLVDVMFAWRECGLFYTVVLAVTMAALFRFRQPDREISAPA